MRAIKPVKPENPHITEEDVKQLKVEHVDYDVEEEFDGTTVTLEPKEDEAKNFDKVEPKHKDVKELSKQLREAATQMAHEQEQKRREKLLMEQIDKLYNQLADWQRAYGLLQEAIEEEGYYIWQCSKCNKIKLGQDPLKLEGWIRMFSLQYPTLCPDCQNNLED